MDRKKIRLEWSAFGIVGLVFFLIGILFLAIGLSIGFSFSRAGLFQNFEEGYLFLAVFGGIGAIFTVIGAVFLFREISKRRRTLRAFESGYYITAKVTGIVRHTNVRINGRCPYTIECQVNDRDTGKLHVYESRYLYFVPDENLVGKEVKVYLDRMDEKSYYVDVDDIIPEVVFHR
ncbi:MAG: phage holin family protein [Clostridiales bacterium]|nr:phage holin family protein [Clostridiales bacterium]